MESVEELLKRFILSKIKNNGPIPFSQFMQWCLYHPEYGYYRSGKVCIGKDGDYYTSPCVHPLFGGLIAKQLVQMSQYVEGPFFDVVEMGGGRGFLCEDILKWIRENHEDLYSHLRYYLIETSPFLLKEQEERLRSYEKEGKVFWMDLKLFEIGRDQMTGCFLSNELVDSFPVHRVVMDQGILKEVYVTHDHGQLKEQLGEVSDPKISSYFHSMGITLQEGQRAEVNLMALDWMEQVARYLREGFVLTIDYGDLSRELYSPYRMDGTFLCYYQHQISEDPFIRLGRQDMTSHVNFTRLIQKGEEMGLKLTGLVSQSQFLIALGLFQEMESLLENRSEIEGLQLRLSLKYLIEPERGMGERFKVLIQHKGVDHPKLDGLRGLESMRRFNESIRNF